jgi:hypothetical protein
MANNRNQRERRVREHQEREVEIEAYQDAKEAVRQRRCAVAERHRRSREARIKATRAAAINPKFTFVSRSDDKIDRRAVQFVLKRLQ